MKQVISGLIAGLVMGLLAGYLIVAGASPANSGSCPATNSAAIEKAVNLFKTEVVPPDIDINERVVSAQTVYHVKLEVYSEDFKDILDMFVTPNGTAMILKDPQCILMVTENGISNGDGPPAEHEVVNVSVDDDPSIGPADAKVVIVEFADYACPACAHFANEVKDKLLENFSGKVRFVFRDVAAHGEISFKAAEAANCAGEQGKYWEYHKLLYTNQKEWINNVSKLYDYAEQLNLDLEAFKACVESGKYREEIQKDMEDAMEYGVSAVPTFFINGKKAEGAMPYEDFARMIEEELK